VGLGRKATFVSALLAVAAAAPAPAADRPRILGISHAAFRVGDLARARAFYADLLGYAVEPTRGGLRVAVNERQYVSVRGGLAAGEDRLDHLALETDGAAALRRELARRGAAVSALTHDESGNPAFTLRDPEGWTIELVEHGARTWPRAAPASPNALSGRILHAGVLVGDLDAANRFYGGLLGLAETWRGSRNGTELSWTNMKLPDGDDYVELMLYAKLPPGDARGTPHHICLEVPDVEAAKARLAPRAAAAGYTRPLEARVGTNRKRQLNLFDADGTRVELMEPRTVDGRPVPSSTAPPPAR
jgi:lactoylglutathione lyase